MTNSPFMRGLLLALAATLAPDVMAADAASSDADLRTRLGAERQAVEARFRQAQVVCRERFVVTPCVEEAKAERRQALRRLREQELALGDTERRARAGARQQAIDAKRRELATRKAPPPSLPASAARMPLPRASAPTASATSASSAASVPQALDGGVAAAAARAQRAAQRRQQADDRLARIETRERERAAKGRKVQPLPTPAEIGASAARR